MADESTVFDDRRDAGRRLAAALGPVDGPTVVLGLPRGGVPVAAEVAAALGAELDVLVVRKLGVPGRAEWAMGAIASGGALVRNEDVISYARVGPEQFAQVLAAEQAELERRECVYRGDRPPAPVADATVVVVDDGIATGATVRAAVEALAERGPARIVLAVPVAPPGTPERFADLVDATVVVAAPGDFAAVGAHYRDFTQTTDEQVRAALAGADETGRTRG